MYLFIFLIKGSVGEAVRVDKRPSTATSWVRGQSTYRGRGSNGGRNIYPKGNPRGGGHKSHIVRGGRGGHYGRW
jgi:hypothetical protein